MWGGGVPPLTGGGVWAECCANSHKITHMCLIVSVGRVIPRFLCGL